MLLPRAQPPSSPSHCTPRSAPHSVFAPFAESFTGTRPPQR
ncbi:hypothetical protein [Lysobacter gummosus]